MKQLRQYVRYDEPHRRDVVVALAKRIGCAESTVWRWLAGQTPSPTMRKAIQRATRGEVRASSWTVTP